MAKQTVSRTALGAATCRLIEEKYLKPMQRALDVFAGERIFQAAVIR